MAKVRKIFGGKPKHPLDYLTFIATSVAAAGAAYAAYFASQQALIAQQVGQSQQRAYLQVVVLKSESRLVPKDKRDIKFVLNVFNSGSSPAYGYQIKTNIKLSNYPIPATFPFIYKSTIHPWLDKSQTIIFPGDREQHFISAGWHFENGELDRMMNYHDAIIIYGIITYFDIFNKFHYLEFCKAYSFIKNNESDQIDYNLQDCNIHNEADFGLN